MAAAVAHRGERPGRDEPVRPLAPAARVQDVPAVGRDPLAAPAARLAAERPGNQFRRVQDRVADVDVERAALRFGGQVRGERHEEDEPAVGAQLLVPGTAAGADLRPAVAGGGAGEVDADEVDDRGDAVLQGDELQRRIESAEPTRPGRAERTGHDEIPGAGEDVFAMWQSGLRRQKKFPDPLGPLDGRPHVDRVVQRQHFEFDLFQRTGHDVFPR